jgi:SET domain-containing protein
MNLISDSCHNYDFDKLDKNIHKYPTIKVETDSLRYLSKRSSPEITPNFKHIPYTIVLFNDLKPISNWMDCLVNNYAEIIRKTRTKYITCILIQYTDLKDYIVRPKNPIIYLSKSTIQGKGVFAQKGIPKGQGIMRFIDHVQGMPFMYHDSYLINHSSKHPNVTLKYVNSDGCNYSLVVSKRLIHKDEELFIDYLSMKHMYPWMGGIVFEEK